MWKREEEEGERDSWGTATRLVLCELLLLVHVVDG